LNFNGVIVMEQTEKQQRVDHANELIKVVAAHGRRFFSSKERVAHIELRRGRVYYVDAYTEKAIYTHKTPFGNEWKGFTEGGTMCLLVEDMRDYIMTGKRIMRWKIVIQQMGESGLENNVWGYDVESARAVREAAYELPIIAKDLP